MAGETSPNKRMGRSPWIAALILNVSGKMNSITLFSHEMQFFTANMLDFIHWSIFKAKVRLCLMANSFWHLLLIGLWFIYQIFSCFGLKHNIPFPPTIIECHDFCSLLQVTFISTLWFCSCSTWLTAVTTVRGNYFQPQGDGDSVWTRLHCCWWEIRVCIWKTGHC